MAVIEGGLVIEGSHERPHRVNVKVTTAQLLALNATPITIVTIEKNLINEPVEFWP